MNHEAAAYGLWGMVVLNSVVFILFAFSFFKPQNARDWRTFGTFSAFIVALFVEMYGVPLTIYFMAGWIQRHYPGLDPLSHDAGHLWYTLLGMSGNPHWNPVHILSNLVVGGGFWLLATSWRVLYLAQCVGQLATTGPYARVRHPQYIGFVLIMAGFLLQWPTLLTLAMFPVLVLMYVRLSRQEELWARMQFGTQWDAYARQVPAFIPHWKSPVR